MYDIPDHPVIRNLEATGNPYGRADRFPHCPICNSEITDVLYNKFRNVIGCKDCINTRDVEDEGELCPVCEQECETYYISENEIVGCDRCIKIKDAWNSPECNPDLDY